MATGKATTKILLDERDIPTHWYNVVPKLPTRRRGPQLRWYC